MSVSSQLNPVASRASYFWAAPLIMYCFGTVSCTDGVLNSGAEFGSPITDNHTVDTTTEFPTESASVAEFPTDNIDETDTPIEQATETETDTAVDTNTDMDTHTDTNDDTDSAGDTDSAWMPYPCAYGGVKLPNSDICWYLTNLPIFGLPPQSCIERCSYNGGVHPDVPKHIGSAAEGGTLKACSDILYWLLGKDIYDLPTAITTPGWFGYGCYHIYANKTNFWIEDLPFDPDAKGQGISRVCGCVH